ncbi:site-specific integrase [Pseudomonas poae]|uniref:site-specific integrase n=1 Tax=Pseudomonas poae TaxID=200451 RepID=UPI0030D6296A
MNNKASVLTKPILSEVDLHRTKRPDQLSETFYWEDDCLVHTGQTQIKMTKALSQLTLSLKASFKHHLISFSKQGDYSPYSYTTVFAALNTTLRAYPSNSFDANWITKALSHDSFLRIKSRITKFFLHWQERDSAAISLDVLRLLDDTAAFLEGPRSVLSDDPEKSWLTDEEYESLLSVVWENYDCGNSSTQVTLVKLLSMQYSRRPCQIALLKIGDIRESDGSDSHGLIGRIIDFPGIKDITAETNFRDSKFEPHPLADHLWNLCNVQRCEVRALYEYTLGFSLSEDQLKKLPLFCSEVRFKEAQHLIEGQYQLNLLENLDSELFHIQKNIIVDIVKWTKNTPNCNYGAKKHRPSLRPQPPISLRTDRTMIVTATRMRHTRARQLARQGVPKHVLAHWLGHTSEQSIDAYYNDPAEQARQLDEAMAPILRPLAMAFAGTLIDSESQATRAHDPISKLEFASASELKSVGRCGKHSFCATTSVPVPCYRCKHFEPLVDAPHNEVLEALVQRQAAEEQMLKIGGQRNLLIPIDLSSDIRAVENCIVRCNARKAERKMKP